MMIFKKDPREDYRVTKLIELALKGRTESHLKHVCEQWGVKGFKQRSYINKVREKVKELKK